MMILLSKLYRVPVVVMGHGKIGDLGEPIIDIKNGQLIAFHLKTGTFLSEKKIISLVDIVVLDPKIIIINKPESIVNASEIIRAKDALEQHFSLMKAKAYTENNTYLGHIEDAVIDTEYNGFVKYYIKNILQNRILPADRVVEIKKNRLIFNDSVLNLEVSSGAAA